MLQNYYVSFTGLKQNKSIQYDNIGTDVLSQITKVAKENKNDEITHWHVLAYAMDSTLDFIDMVEAGELTAEDAEAGYAPAFFAYSYSNDLYKDSKYREKFKDFLLDERETVQDNIDKLPKTRMTPQKVELSKEFKNDIVDIRSMFDREKMLCSGVDFWQATFLTHLPNLNKYMDRFEMKLNDLYMIEDKNDDERLHFSNYDKPAKNIVKNLDLGTSMFVTYDKDKVDPEYFIPSIIKAVETNTEGKLNSTNSEIIEFNKNITMDHFNDKILQLKKDKTKNHIVVFPQGPLIKSCIDDQGNLSIPLDYTDALEKTPDNIRFVAIDCKDNYLSLNQLPTVAKAYADMGETSIPVLNSGDVVKALQENTAYTSKFKQGLSKKTLEKIVDISSQMSGNYPVKTISLLKKVSAHYVDKKEITSKDVEKFAENADYISKSTDNNGSVEIVFDTGKRLKDIVGKTNTKKEAENVIKQIKNGTIGTKGFIVYSQDGMAGGGRRHTAEVIAGESKAPFVAINTMDFGTKDVDLFDGSLLSPEASIKKIFSLVSTQAESNPHKAAVLFIENFEYFSVGELVSEYHQKAMSQLLREMENAEKKGLNIVVMGSVSNPQFIGDATMKSFKFNDNIEISSPAFNEEERLEVLKHTIKENKIKLAGSGDEQEKVLKSMAKTLDGFSFIELKSFVKKADTISQERNHKVMTKEDMIESYLRLTTGRPSTHQDFPHEKELVTKHECGHAITLQVMNDLMKKQNKPWLIPDTVNFITLDPRSYYGGAMYHAEDVNNERSFERNFADIVCSYGGHSSEKKFYDMDGSWGITCDLDHVTSLAEKMATAMGQGYYTGKISIANMYQRRDFKRNVTDNLREKIEKDVNVVTRNALAVSDLIVESYSGFINEFSDKYSHLVGTGDCLIDGDVFRQELADWKDRQTPEKRDELKTLDGMILDAIQASKNGKIY